MSVADAVLPLFPGAGFETSLLTAVLVGILVVLLFHETLGWGFAGLVVPGYLASIFMVLPVAGVVLLLETAVTYGVVLAYARVLAPRLGLGPLFGRERFFALLLVSICIRVLADGWVLPHLGVWSVELGATGDTGLYSVGLVVVPLSANVMWTPGFRRGALQLVVTTGVSFLLLRLLLVPYTNLAISDFVLSFEDIATSFVASPKACIILLSGSLLATIAVRWFGWSVGGTLVPGLLAIAWLTPLKAVATFAEVVVVLAVAMPLRHYGLLRGASFSRRLVAAFVLLYGLKLLAAAAAPSAWPGLRVTDLFGLGYVLPALLVERVWALQSAVRVLLPTAVLSAVGTVVGVGVGYSLEQLLPRSNVVHEQPAEETRP